MLLTLSKLNFFLFLIFLFLIFFFFSITISENAFHGSTCNEINGTWRCEEGLFVDDLKLINEQLKDQKNIFESKLKKLAVFKNLNIQDSKFSIFTEGITLISEYLPNVFWMSQLYHPNLYRLNYQFFEISCKKYERLKSVKFTSQVLQRF